jgi:hypothetical protein
MGINATRKKRLMLHIHTRLWSMNSSEVCIRLWTVEVDVHRNCNEVRVSNVLAEREERKDVQLRAGGVCGEPRLVEVPIQAIEDLRGIRHRDESRYFCQNQSPKIIKESRESSLRPDNDDDMNGCKKFR